MARFGDSRQGRHARPQGRTLQGRTRRRLLVVSAIAGLVVLTTSVIVIAQPDRLPLDGVIPPEEIGTAAAPSTPREPRRTGPDVDVLPPAKMTAAERREKARQRRLHHDQLRRKARLAERISSMLVPTSFRVASYNVLGASHTVGGGSHRGFASGGSRMATGVGYLRAIGADVVGFQEFEDPQYSTFSALAPEYAVWPGRELGPKSIRFSIAWNTNSWTLVEAQSVGVPYAGGGYIQMPYVRLQNNASGRQIWFANFHNPADTPNLGNNGRWRAVGMGIQIGLANRLRSETGLPVIFTGDFNDRAGVFCSMTGQTDLVAANGGSTGSACAPPSAMQVDWIFGSEDLAFSNYYADRGAPVPRMTDHPVVRADVYLAPELTPKQARRMRLQQHRIFSRERRAEAKSLQPAPRRLSPLR